MKKITIAFFLLLSFVCVFSADYFPLSLGDWWNYEYRYKPTTTNCPLRPCWTLNFGEYYRQVYAIHNDTFYIMNVSSIDSAYRHPARGGPNEYLSFDDTVRHEPALKETTTSIFVINDTLIMCEQLNNCDFPYLKKDLKDGDSISIKDCGDKLFHADSTEIDGQLLNTLRGFYTDSNMYYEFSSGVGLVRCSTHCHSFCIPRIPEVCFYLSLSLKSSNRLNTNINQNGDLFNNNPMLGIRPNPFNPSTRISYNLGPARIGTMQIFDIRGKMVFERPIQGSGTVVWDASGLGSGVYVLKVISAGKTYGRKLVLQR